MTRAMEAAPEGEYVLEPGWILAWRDGAPELIRDGSILVSGDRFESVESERMDTKLPRVSLPRDIVFPGFISGHTHACSATPTRGLIETGRSFARPYELVEEMDADDMDDLTAFNVAELLRSGCTTHVEMSLSQKQVESYVRVAREWGVRAYPSVELPGADSWNEIWFHPSDDSLLESEPRILADIQRFRDFAAPINGAEDGRIRPMMAPHATDTHTPETMKASLAVARELGNGLHIHLAQSPDEAEKVERMWGVRPVEWLRDLGFLDERLFAAHLWYIDLERDIPILAEARDFTYVHCPSALGAGGTNATQPYPELLAAGLNISIGVDTHSNDYVENLKLAVIDGRARCFLSEESSSAPMQLPTPWDAVRSATDHAASGLGREDLGRIEPGAKADFCTLDVSGFLVGVGALPPDPLNHLLYANGLSVRHAATDGRFQVFDGHLVVGDEEDVIRRGGAVAEKLWRTLAAEGYFDGEPSYPPQWPHSWRASNVVNADTATLKEVPK